MLTEDINTELGSLIRRLEARVRMGLTQGQRQDPERLTLESIEDAIIGLVLLHIQLRTAGENRN